jgi:hypothetical protein
LRQRCVLTRDKAAIHHPIHFPGRTSNLNSRFRRITARWPSYYRSIAQPCDRDIPAGIVCASALRGPGRRHRFLPYAGIQPGLKRCRPARSFVLLCRMPRTLRPNAQMCHTIDRVSIRWRSISKAIGECRRSSSVQ